MSHEVYKMAYTGRAPWHINQTRALSTEIAAGSPFDQWIDDGGFDWEIKKADVFYTDSNGIERHVPDRYVLFRSDTGAPISIMSARYQEVQPRQVLEFFREVCETQNWQMETAGILRGGAQYWALAKVGLNADVSRGDTHHLYTLLATSADGSLATIGDLTSVRVVCANTLSVAMRAASGKRVSIKHSARFDARQMQRELGMIDYESSWDAFVADMRKLQQVTIDQEQARDFFADLLRPKQDRPAARQNLGASDFTSLLNAPVGVGYHPVETDKAETTRAIRGLENLMESYQSAPGAEPGNAYGLVQGMTHWLDHERGKDSEKRLSSAWFGQGAQLKAKTVSKALELAR